MSHYLSPERKGMVTASLAPRIVYGSDQDRYQLWEELTDQREPEDLSNVFAVQWGKHNETFILDWVEEGMHAEITERQRWCKHPTLPFGATIDGYRPQDDAVVECKVLGPFLEARTASGAPGFLDYYSPQVVLQMLCRPADRGWLCIQQGNSPPQMFMIERDAAYEQDVLERLTVFAECVARRTPPSPPPPAPVRPELWRTIDLEAHSQENWVPSMRANLLTWAATRGPAQTHEQTKADIKKLLPDDVGRVNYNRIQIRRSRNGAVTVSEK